MLLALKQHEYKTVGNRAEDAPNDAVEWLRDVARPWEQRHFPGVVELTYLLCGQVTLSTAGAWIEGDEVVPMPSEVKEAVGIVVDWLFAYADRAT